MEEKIQLIGQKTILNKLLLLIDPVPQLQVLLLLQRFTLANNLNLYKKIAAQDGKILILAADSAFDVTRLRKLCAARNIELITSSNPRRNNNTPVTHVLHRWLVERAFGWLSWYRGIKICWAKSRQSHLAFLNLVIAIQLSL